MALLAHPAAALFPMIEGDAFLHFAESIRKRGLEDQIVLLDDQILDGRNRYRALQHIRGATMSLAKGEFRLFNPATEGDPLEWVLARNMDRRQMSDGQKAMVGARMTLLGTLGGEVLHPPMTVDVAASRVGVSGRSIQQGRRILEQGIPELVRLVCQGLLAVDQGELAAKLDRDLQTRVVDLVVTGAKNAARTAAKQYARNEREKLLGKKICDMPDGKFGVILADPEWKFVVFSEQTGLDRGAENHYPTTGEKEISERDVEKIAAKDCLLCLWVTDLARGIRVMEAWGFEFKSYFVWAKDIVQVALPVIDAPETIQALCDLFDVTPGDIAAGKLRLYREVGAAGTGYWNRDRDELLLIGTRGHVVAPAMGTQPESVMFAARPQVDGKKSKHSAKPLTVHQWIEKNWPNTPKIEMNARQARAGWTLWGNEAPAQEVVVEK